jgi:hypothetical protein
MRWFSLSVGLSVFLSTAVWVGGQENKASPHRPVLHKLFNSPTAAGISSKLAQLQILELHFSKKQNYPNTCWTAKGMQYGNTLVCPINLDQENVPANLRILDIHGSCSPATGAGRGDWGPCSHTIECPGFGICDKHLYRSSPDPNQLTNGNYRQANWYGWTNDGNEALLTILVTVGP